MESLVNWLTQNLSGVIENRDLLVGIISMLPLIELRGGLIAAALLDVPPIQANIACIIGNIIPVPFILLFITKIFDWMKRWKIFRPLIEKLESKKNNKKSEQIKKYEFWGIVLFVGIPLPGTGAWTGSLIAALLGIDLKKSIPAVILGILLAATIMTTVSYFIPWLIKVL